MFSSSTEEHLCIKKKVLKEFNMSENQFEIPEPDQETIKYLQHVEEDLDKEGIEDDAVEMLIDNILEEIGGQQLSLAIHGEASRILEKILHLANSKQLSQFFLKFNNDHFHLMFTDRFGSHVAETLLSLVSEKIFAGEAELLDIFISMCSLLEPYCFSLLSDTFASHVIRTILDMLCGEGLASGELNRSKKSSKYRAKNRLTDATAKERSSITSLRKNGFKPLKTAPPIFSSTLARLVRAITGQITSADLRILAVHPSASPVLQLLMQIEYLYSTRQIKTCDDGSFGAQNTILHLLFNISSNADLDTVELTEYDLIFETLTTDPIGSHFMDCVIELAPSGLLKQLFERYFKGHVRDLSLHNQANFVIGRLVGNAPNAEVMERIFTELAPETKSGERGKHFEKMIRQRKHTILVELAKGCLRFRCNLELFCSHLLSALGLNHGDTSKAAECVLYMQHSDRFQGDAKSASLPFGVSIAGSQLLSTLFKYPQEQQALFFSSYLSISDERRLAICCDLIGSRFMDLVLNSAEVNRKVKTKMFLSLFQHVEKLAVDKNGSHVIDSAWKILGIDYKVKVAEKLLSKYNKIVSVIYGKFVLRNCKIDEFRSSKKDWVAKQQSLESKKRMISEIFEEPEPFRKSQRV